MSRRSLFLILATISFLIPSCQVQPEIINLTIAGGAAGRELELTVLGTQRFMEKHPYVRVNVRPIPQTLEGRLELYKTLLESESTEVDVFQIDVVWVGMFAKHALDLVPLIDPAEVAKHYPSTIENNTVDGKLVALPWYVDVPSLFYRDDLLEKYGFSKPPETWEELESMARTVVAGERKEGNLGLSGYLWQGSKYEGLTCNALEWQFSNGGGNFINGEGQPNLTSTEAVKAFERAAGWLKSISPTQVLTYDEEDSRVVWQNGNGVFLRGWSYVNGLAKTDEDISSKFAVAPLPQGPAGRAATLGGWQLMVSRYSSHPQEATELVQFLTGQAEQKRRAIQGSYNPSIRALYQDPEV